jgi:hypothetical protein
MLRVVVNTEKNGTSVVCRVTRGAISGNGLKEKNHHVQLNDDRGIGAGHEGDKIFRSRASASQ